MKPLNVTDDSFESEVLQSNLPVIVDFWAVWCGPCRQIAPILEEMSVEYDGKLKITKLDVDSNQNSTIKYGVRSIPTLLIFKDGKLADTIIGALPKAQLVQRINTLL